MQGVRDKIGLYLGLFRARGWHFLQLRKRSLSRLVSKRPGRLDAIESGASAKSPL
jgi:hypothetical protein